MSCHYILEIDGKANPENYEYLNTAVLVDSAILGHIGRILFCPKKAVLLIIRKKLRYTFVGG